MRRWLATMLLVLGAIIVRAQVEGVPRDVIEQRIEAAVEQLGGDNDVDLTNLFQVLLDHYNDPIDLNSTNAQELSSMMLLNDVQISSLLQHIARNGKLQSVYELQTINGWDVATINMIRPFVTVRESPNATRASLKEMLKQGSNELTLRSTMNIESRKGFMDRPNIFGKDYYDPDGEALPDFGNDAVRDSLRANNKLYLGSPFRLYTRYRFRYRQNVSFGFTAEKDEGEEFFRGTQPQGYDFYSAHLFLREAGRFKRIAIGDYSAQFGQGLTFWNGLAFASKSSYSLNVKRNGMGLAPYTSVNENLFMRGAAATLEVAKGLELTGFVSKKRIDGNVTALPSGQDTLDTQIEQVVFSSFQEDGFHRTQNEVDKKDAIGEQIVGGHLRYSKRTWSIGATGARIDYDAVLSRSLKPYNQFEFQGSTNTTMGVDWNVLCRNITWFGEVARSANGGVAMNTGILAALDRRVSMSLLLRDYGRDYQGLYSVAFAEGTNPWNERGVYTGIEIRPSRQWQINAYFDRFAFPWLRYQVNAPSDGFDWLLQANWRPSKKVEIYGRVRHQERDRNTTEDIDGIDPLVRLEQTNYRVNVTAKVSSSVTLRSRIETVDYQLGSAPLEHGFLMYQDLIHRPLRSPVELTARFALFESGGYNARVYAYENDLIGVFSIPAYYGRGVRWYGMVRFTPMRRVDVWVRYGAWIYRDQTVISSGLQEVPGTMRSDLKMQVRWTF